eukprot:TRINITY_DN3757_c0_g1_i2.p1 TRINITY_DN3757_c0_g1~~TRINITY_DN3757_c0_g1_i2.p1  ORF type:complete len:165 (+),score=26.64 TRINITY_DN3757_c0_g1_i2:109-603(+)
MGTLATLAAGCFWSVELIFQRAPGVLRTAVGYTGGHKASPTYREVCSGNTGHAEAVQLEYDPSVISYDQILDIFWHKHDPTQVNRQGNDVGTQYRSAIFYHSEEQRVKAQASLEKEQARLGKKIATEITAASTFYPAEEYHQQYLEKGGQCSSKGCTDKIRCYG